MNQPSTCSWYYWDCFIIFILFLHSSSNTDIINSLGVWMTNLFLVILIKVTFILVSSTSFTTFSLNKHWMLSLVEMRFLLKLLLNNMDLNSFLILMIISLFLSSKTEIWLITNQLSHYSWVVRLIILFNTMIVRFLFFLLLHLLFIKNILAHSLLHLLEVIYLHLQLLIVLIVPKKLLTAIVTFDLALSFRLLINLEIGINYIIISINI